MLNNYDSMWDAINARDKETPENKPESMFDAIQPDPDSDKEQINEADTDQLEYKMTAAVTEYDRKQSAGKSYNKYALSQYLARVGEVIQDIKAGAEPRAAVIAAFHGRLTDAVLKAIGQPTSKTGELPRGLAYKPVVKEAEDFAYEDPEGRDPDEARLEAEGDWEREEAENDEKLKAANPDVFSTDAGPADDVSVADTLELAQILGFELDEEGQIVTVNGTVSPEDFHAKIVKDIEEIALMNAKEDSGVVVQDFNESVKRVREAAVPVRAINRKISTVRANMDKLEKTDAKYATLKTKLEKLEDARILLVKEAKDSVDMTTPGDRKYDDQAEHNEMMKKRLGVRGLTSRVQAVLKDMRNQPESNWEALLMAFAKDEGKANEGIDSEGADVEEATATMSKQKGLFGVAVGAWTSKDYEKMAQAIDEMGVSEFFTMLQNRLLAKKNQYQGLKMLEAMIQAYRSVREGSDELPANESAVNEMNGYVCHFNGKREEVYAETSLAARDKAAAIWKVSPKKLHMISTTLAEKDVDDETGKGEQVTHTPSESVSEEYGSVGNSPEDRDISKLFDKLEELRANGEDKVKGGTYDVILKRLRSLTRERLNKSGVQSTNLRTGAVDKFESVEEADAKPKEWLNTKAVYKDAAEKMATAKRQKDQSKYKFEYDHIRKMMRLEDVSNKVEIGTYWNRVYNEEMGLAEGTVFEAEETRKVKAVGTPEPDQLAELSELWRTSRTAAGQDHHKRMQWTADQYSKKNPDKSTLGAYKWLERMLAGVYSGRE